jgi:uncharacterized protein (TIGR03083 family)
VSITTEPDRRMVTSVANAAMHLSWRNIVNPWEAITADRQSFATYLASLSADDWNTPSWCAGWSVKDVVAHLLVTPTMSKGQIFRAFAGSGFNLDKMTSKLVAGMRSMPAQAMVDKVRSTAGVHSAPPGLKPIGVLAETLVHAADIAGTVGKPISFPADHSVMTLEHLKNVQPVLGCKKRIAGLTMRATDVSWSTGEGPAVEGTAQALMAAMTGRQQALASLSGEGLEVFRSRI